jgi:hypothetical protein
MPPNLIIRKGSNYVHAIVTVPTSIEILKELFSGISGAAREWGFTRFLVDFRQAKKITTAGTDFTLANTIAAELGLSPAGTRHALIVKPEARMDFDFVETVFRNAGYNLRVFIDEAAAVEWLTT